MGLRANLLSTHQTLSPGKRFCLHRRRNRVLERQPENTPGKPEQAVGHMPCIGSSIIALQCGSLTECLPWVPPSAAQNTEIEMFRSSRLTWATESGPASKKGSVRLRDSIVVLQVTRGKHAPALSSLTWDRTHSTSRWTVKGWG